MQGHGLGSQNAVPLTLFFSRGGFNNDATTIQTVYNIAEETTASQLYIL